MDNTHITKLFGTVIFRSKRYPIKNILVVAKGEGLGGALEWEIGVSRCKLLYRKNK